MSILEDIFETGNVSSKELETLLQMRNNRAVDFVLIDIRERWEFEDRSIVGCDILFPTTLMDQNMETLQRIKHKNIILYCRTGNRTGFVLNILKRMGFENVAHLHRGIVDYFGQTHSNAPIPI